jgi:hypothetical protein
MTDHIITIKTWCRYNYYKDVLDALARCRGIEKYKILNMLDAGGGPDSNEIQKLDKTHELKDQIITFPAQQVYGCAGNTHRSFEFGFSYDTDFVIHLEDDTVPSIDYLEYMEWCNEQYSEDEEIFVAVGWNRRTDKDTVSYDSELHLTGIRQSPVTYQGWGMWRRIWDKVKDGWFGIHWINGAEPSKIPYGKEFLKLIYKSPDGSWGWPMKNYWPAISNETIRKEVYPYISRIQNIGANRGRFNPDPEWHQANIHTHVWAEDKERTKDFQETKDMDLN